jgi:telomerase reverse transcriptase
MFTKVYRYVALVTKVVIPKAFWGCDKNFKLILHRMTYSLVEPYFLRVRYRPDVKDFINCRRFETLSLHHILQGFSTSECDWLMPSGLAARNQPRVSVTDALKRKELLEDFVFWYFDSFVSSLLKVWNIVSSGDNHQYQRTRQIFISQNLRHSETGCCTSVKMIGGHFVHR